jgi:thiamine pyrophosphate-dependent acetolactate synthase large subunit-like protein
VQAGEALLQALDACGVQDIFSSPGSDWPPVWEALAARRAAGQALPRYVNCRHEELAAAMALGYARASGRLPAVLLHTGVGVLHAAMAIHIARQDRVPMLVLAGDSISFGEDRRHDPGAQWLRSLVEPGGPAGQAQPYTKWAASVGSVEALPGMLEHASRIALTTPRGPTMLSIPMEVLLADVPAHLVPRETAMPSRTRPDARAVARVARMLVESKAPVLLTEYAGSTPGAMEQLVELADLLAIPMVEARAPACTNFPTDHSLHLGYDALGLVDAADLVLLVGCVTPWHPASRRPAGNAAVVVLDEDADRAYLPTWGYPADEIVPGALDHTLADLLAAVRAAMQHQPPPAALLAERRARAEAEHRRLHQTWQQAAEAGANQTPLSEAWVLQQLAELLPDNAVVIEETTTTHTLIDRYIPRTRPGSYYSRVAGGLGTMLCQALGVKLAQPDRLVVSLVGDGAFYYNPVPSCLGLAQEYDLPTLTVVFDNRSYAAMEASLLKYYPDGAAARTGVHFGGPISPETDYAGYARLHGGFGARADRPDQVRPAFEQALRAVQAGQQAIVHLVVKPGRGGG